MNPNKIVKNDSIRPRIHGMVPNLKRYARCQGRPTQSTSCSNSSNVNVELLMRESEDLDLLRCVRTVPKVWEGNRANGTNLTVNRFGMTHASTMESGKSALHHGPGFAKAPAQVSYFAGVGSQKTDQKSQVRLSKLLHDHLTMDYVARASLKSDEKQIGEDLERLTHIRNEIAYNTGFGNDGVPRTKQEMKRITSLRRKIEILRKAIINMNSHEKQDIDVQMYIREKMERVFSTFANLSPNVKQSDDVSHLIKECHDFLYKNSADYRLHVKQNLGDIQELKDRTEYSYMAGLSSYLSDDKLKVKKNMDMHYRDDEIHRTATNHGVHFYNLPRNNHNRQKRKFELRNC